MAALGLTADQVQVISPYTGGGFGQKNSLQMQTVLVAVAARRLQRPLKLVVSRAQIFHDASFRAASRQRVRLGADRSGQMLAAIHEVDAQTSRHDFMPAEFAAVSSRLYGIENFRGHERLVRTDVQTPGYMRAPFEHGACVAVGAYPGLIVPTVARLKVTDDGGVRLSIGGHEMGQGIRTALAAAVARKLAVPPEGVVVLVGDTRIAPQHVTAGSWGTASAVPTASDAAEAMLQALDQLAPGRSSNQTPAQILKSARRPLLEVEVRRKAPGQPDAIYDRLAAGLPCVGGPIFADFVTFSYIAHFIEVRVEPGTRRIRVPRVVSVADCGRVISPRTAASQVRGGVVWGIGATLREVSDVDPRYGGFLNADLAEYVLAAA